MLANQEWWKKTKYPERCINMKRDFTTLVYLVGGMMGEDASKAYMGINQDTHRSEERRVS